MNALMRSALILCAAAAFAGAVVGAGNGWAAGIMTAGLVAAPGGLALGVGHRLAVGHRRFSSLRRTLAFAAAAAVGTILVAVGAGVGLMFVSDHDAVVVSSVAVAAGIVAFRVADLAAAGIAADVGGVRDGLVAVGDGARVVIVPGGARDEIGELARAAEAMAARLASEEDARRTLFAGVSHDLRTPIASLRLLVDAIEDDLVDEETRSRYLATMDTHVRALGTLVDDLFELSRLEAGDLDWTRRQVSLAALVEEAVEALGPEARTRGITVRAELPEPGLATQADPERLQRVLFNLIRNALRHTPADGSVTVRAEPGPGGVEIEVSDTGPGIPAADRERVFEPFYRGGGDAARGAEGAGLGLAISRAIVERHGGRIWLPESDAGARVRFSLPGV